MAYESTITRGAPLRRASLCKEETGNGKRVGDGSAMKAQWKRTGEQHTGDENLLQTEARIAEPPSAV